jgi:hypothetical protein
MHYIIQCLLIGNVHEQTAEGNIGSKEVEVMKDEKTCGTSEFGFLV